MNRMFLLVPALLLMAGCDTIHWPRPLYLKADLVAEPAIEGRWLEADGTLTIETSNGGYKLTYQGAKETSPSLTLDAHLLRLGACLYVDAVSTDQDLPAHHYFRLEFHGEALRVWSMDDGWALKQAKTGALRNEVFEARAGQDRHYVITSSTEELQRFVVDHADVAWINSTEFTRAR